MSVELRVQLPVVREHDADGLVRVDGAELDVGAGADGAAGLPEVAVVRAHLQAVGAAHLQQRLVARLARHGVAHLERELERVARRVEVGVVEHFAARCGRDVT